MLNTERNSRRIEAGQSCLTANSSELGSIPLNEMTQGLSVQLPPLSLSQVEALIKTSLPRLQGSEAACKAFS